ncbi:MAG: Asp-tRNA(Asn)/Glu-tRNA(Gln) amidotransferase subunit GatC [Anaerolineales bacterium]|nr:Asp-tRNA(Asn)/Glu-tRNA(Gln) amidotransferase subunit GatC [Anaerolineales bacterium]
MPLSLEEVERIATLARLELSAEEKTRYRQQLSAILDYIRKLQELDTTDIAPTSSAPGGDSSLRADEPRPGLSRADLFRNAPETEQEQFKIPPVFE